MDTHTHNPCGLPISMSFPTPDLVPDALGFVGDNGDLRDFYLRGLADDLKDHHDPLVDLITCIHWYAAEPVVYN